MSDNIHFITLSVDLGSEKYLPSHEFLSVVVRISKILQNGVLYFRVWRTKDTHFFQVLDSM